MPRIGADLRPIVESTERYSPERAAAFRPHADDGKPSFQSCSCLIGSRADHAVRGADEGGITVARWGARYQMKVATVLLASSVALAGPITFDTWPTAGDLPNGYNQDGLSIYADPAPPGSRMRVTPYAWQPTDPSDDPPPGTPGVPDTWGFVLALNTEPQVPPGSVFTLVFDRRAYLGGFLIADTNHEPSPRVRIEALLGDTIVDSRTLDSLYAVFDYGGLLVDRLRFIDLGGDGHAIDDLRFALTEFEVTEFGLTEEAIPEPSTLVLVGVGLIAMATWRGWRCGAGGRALPFRSASVMMNHYAQHRRATTSSSTGGPGNV
jgi:hypothetical protein